MLDNAIIGLLILVLGNSIYVYYKKKRQLLNIEEINFDLLRTNDEIKKILLLGLYSQFAKNNENTTNKPTDLEGFVANVMENYFGGVTYLVGGSGDYGVDIEHERNDGKYLGQVKCHAPNDPIPFDPIALIHSNMIKEKAQGGFVVTTSTFSDNAIKYNDNLNIELIDGVKLVNYWLEGLEKQLELAKSVKKEAKLEYQ